jgi:hypothetical protein
MMSNRLFYSIGTIVETSMSFNSLFHLYYSFLSFVFFGQNLIMAYIVYIIILFDKYGVLII